MIKRFISALYACSTNKPGDLYRAAVAASFGIFVPISICVMRPHIAHMMLSAIMTVAGKETGSTLLGLSDMQLSSNTATKTIEGHYSCHTKSIITQPKNVYVQRNIMSAGYIGGCNTKFIGETGGGDEIASHNEILKGYKELLQFCSLFQQSSSALSAVKSRPNSMLCMQIPFYSTSSMLEPAFSISSRFLPYACDRQNNPIEAEKAFHAFPGGPIAFHSFSSLLHTDKMLHMESDPLSDSGDCYFTGGQRHNSIVIKGPYRVLMGKKESDIRFSPGQGHWGADARPGDARWRRGESVSVEDARSFASGSSMLY
jgi:hypothetical protein